MKLALFLILFLCLCSLIIINNNELNISKKEDLKKFSELYSDWFKGFYSNIGKATGYITKMSWVP